MSDNDYKGTIAAFVVGGLIGAALGLLFAPRSGKETRKKVKAFVEDMEEKAGDLYEEGKEKLSELKNKLHPKEEK